MVSRETIVSRLACAILGGYFLGNAAAVLLSQVLWGTRGGTVLASMILSFLFYAAAAIWAFVAKTAWRAWGWIVSLALGLFGISYLLANF